MQGQVVAWGRAIPGRTGSNDNINNDKQSELTQDQAEVRNRFVALPALPDLDGQHASCG